MSIDDKELEEFMPALELDWTDEAQTRMKNVPFFVRKSVVRGIEQYAKDKNPLKVWQGHWAGIEQPYCHMEKLLKLEQLPPHGFTVACFPWKIKGASGGYVRAVAMFD